MPFGLRHSLVLFDSVQTGVKPASQPASHQTAQAPSIPLRSSPCMQPTPHNNTWPHAMQPYTGEAHSPSPSITLCSSFSFHSRDCGGPTAQARQHRSHRLALPEGHAGSVQPTSAGQARQLDRWPTCSRCSAASRAPSPQPPPPQPQPLPLGVACRQAARWESNASVAAGAFLPGAALCCWCRR